jgi:hypothetical protein
MIFTLVLLALSGVNERLINGRMGAVNGRGCVLSADKGEVWLHVYQETGNSEKGSLVWDGHLSKDGTQPLDAQPNDRIRYDYKNDVNDPFHGNVGASCQNGATVSVP